MPMDQRAFIDPNKCQKCKKCKVMEVCPADAIEREDLEDPPYVTPMCQGCAKCKNACPFGAVSMI